MRYYEFTFRITPALEAANDVLAALLAEIGFETFQTTGDNQLQAYVQQTQFTQTELDETIRSFPLPDLTIAYTKTVAEDRDWNETWENEGFEPIYVGNRLVVCDKRHQVETEGMHILIHPRLAFGTGSHQTTRMLLATLLEFPLQDQTVIDAGCGTGILGILCLLRGAAHVMAYDIDEWSVENTRHNATLNPIQAARLEVRHGDASVLHGDEAADLLIANINRNILLADIPRFSQALKPHATLLLSGFYRSDVPLLEEAAAQHGFHIQQCRHDEEWCMLCLTR